MAESVKLSDLPIGATAVVREYPKTGTGSVRLRGVGAPAEEDVAGHGLVRGAGGERVGARQVDDGDRLAVLRVGGAHLLLHGHARVVADLLL